MDDTDTFLINPASIGIIGYGIVGQAVAYGFSRLDVKDKYTISNEGWEEIPFAVEGNHKNN